VLFHLPEVVSTMWTHPSYPNTAAQIARPLMRANVVDPSVAVATVAADRSAIRVDMPWLTSGGKATPADGQEHPRTEL